MTISGLVQKPKIFSWEDFMHFPQVEEISDFHCVASWSRLDKNWKGVRLTDIAKHCGVLSKAKFVYINAYDAYSTNLPLAEAMKLDVLISTSMGRISVNDRP